MEFPSIIVIFVMSSNSGGNLADFSRSDITRSIENLTSKWQRDEKDNAKREAATKPTAEYMPAPLDNISEVRDGVRL